MTDLDMQRRISRLQGSGGKSHQSFLAFSLTLHPFCLDNGPNNQSMTSLSSTNSVIIPGEKAYQLELKMQMKQQ